MLKLTWEEAVENRRRNLVERALWIRNECARAMRSLDRPWYEAKTVMSSGDILDTHPRCVELVDRWYGAYHFRGERANQQVKYGMWRREGTCASSVCIYVANIMPRFLVHVRLIVVHSAEHNIPFLMYSPNSSALSISASSTRFRFS